MNPVLRRAVTARIIARPAVSLPLARYAAAAAIRPSRTLYLAAASVIPPLVLLRQRTFATISSAPDRLDMTYPPTPTSPPSWSYTPATIASAISHSIERTTSVLDAVASVPIGERTFENVVRPIAVREGEMSIEVEPGIFLQYVSGEEAVRDASVEGDKALQEFGLGSVTRMDVYKALLDAKVHTEKNGVQLSAEEIRLMDKMILERTRNGLALGDAEREKLVELKKKIMGLEVDFQRNCNEEKGSLLFTAEQLVGVPADIISGYKKEGDQFRVSFKTPDITPLFKFATLSATRKAAILGYEGKTIANAPLLAEIVELRREVAALLGFENWAAYVLQVKMAKTPEKVFEFLDDLENKLRPLGEKEKSELLTLKKVDCEARGIAFVNELFLWDYRYYDRVWQEKNLGLDEEAVKEYFPVSKVVPAILEIYRQLLNVRFYPVPKTAEAGGMTWHEDAEMYAVWDGGEGGKDGKFLGYMHLDLFPRENKYGHAAVWGLIPGFTKEDGSRNFPVVCMVANLAKPTPTRPALMKHGDVVTFFHEMGHAFHGLCSETQFAYFHGTSVSRDFVEAPSQMLENWCWTRDQLRSMSEHYERPGECLPDAMIKSIIASKSVGQGLFNLRQIFHGKYDMVIHTQEKKDLTKLWCDLRESTSLVSSEGEYVGGQSGFAHIVGGYSAGYYGYLYSQSFSADMFQTVFAPNPMDPARGAEYRRKILGPGGSRDEMESLVDFLGRAPDSKAFLESLMGPKMEVESHL